jgi:glycopeptide antibiotics resistance protein
MSPRKVVVLLLWVGLTAAIISITLGPVPQRLEGSEATKGVLSPTAWDVSQWSGSNYEFGLNLLMFLPWGMLALFLLGRRRWWLAAAIGIALTLAIEIAQIPSPRISDPRDLVANTLGALLGIAAALLLLAARRTTPAIHPAPS